MELSTPNREPREDVPTRTTPSAPAIPQPDPDLTLTPIRDSPASGVVQVRAGQKISRLASERGVNGKKKVTFEAVPGKTATASTSEGGKSSLPVGSKSEYVLQTVDGQLPSAKSSTSSSLRKSVLTKKSATKSSLGSNKVVVSRLKKMVEPATGARNIKQAERQKTSSRVAVVQNRMFPLPNVKVTCTSPVKKVTVKQCVTNYPQEPNAVEPNLAEPELNTIQKFMDHALKQIHDNFTADMCVEDEAREKSYVKLSFHPDDRVYRDLVSLNICEDDSVTRMEKRLQSKSTRLHPKPRERDPDPVLSDFSSIRTRQAPPIFPYPSLQVSSVLQKAPASAAFTLCADVEKWGQSW